MASNPPKLRLALAGIVLAIVLSAAFAPRAMAHAALLDSTPAPGARVEASPSQITLHFTEPLNRRLTQVQLVRTAGGEQLPAESQASSKELVLRAQAPLAKGPYRVTWHTVSTQDGHALEGSFSFGVRAAATGGAHQVEQSPLARSGWVRIALRGVFYASLFLFAGGVLLAAMFGGRPGDWLVPAAIHSNLRAAGTDPVRLAARTEARTLEAGIVALGASIAVALEEAADAAGGFSIKSASDFLLTNTAGLARVATVCALAVALLAARRLPRVAAIACVLLFLAIALGGHANSANPRLLAVLTDWLHLVAGALWLGGIAQIAVTWLRQLPKAPGELRLEVMRFVLKRFGAVALPAFLAVATTGLANALIQLGRVSALWGSPYGRVLAIKIALVGLIALASYAHAIRLRPRLLTANPHPPEQAERRHWRLLGTEPLLGIGVVLAAATLVAFPLPPRQLKESDAAQPGRAEAPPCDPCPLPRPRADELATAEQAGSSIVAAWIRHERKGLAGQLRVLGIQKGPVRTRPRFKAAELKPCGAGCWNFRLPTQPAKLRIGLPQGGRLYTAQLPAHWSRDSSVSATRLLDKAQARMRDLHTVRQSETITSGPGSFAATHYQLVAPNRFAYRTNGGARSIAIGTDQWTRGPQETSWQKDRFGGGGPGFRTRSWFSWTNYAQTVRLLGMTGQGHRRMAELALMDPGTPVWYRLTVQLATLRVVAVRMIAAGHFMHQRFYAFNEPLRIAPPR